MLTRFDGVPHERTTVTASIYYHTRLHNTFGLSLLFWKMLYSQLHNNYYYGIEG